MKLLDKLIENMSKNYVQNPHSKEGYGKIRDDLKKIKDEIDRLESIEQVYKLLSE